MMYKPVLKSVVTLFKNNNVKPFTKTKRGGSVYKFIWGFDRSNSMEPKIDVRLSEAPKLVNFKIKVGE